MCEINRLRHLAYLLHVHVVFMTKHRRPVFGELHHANMRQYAAKVCTGFGAELEECDSEANHIHMLIEYPPLVQLTKLVNGLKSITSRRLRSDFIDLRAAYSKPIPWSRFYFTGSCGGASLEVVKKYIQNQRG